MRPAPTSAAFVLLVGFLGLACSAAGAEDWYFREGPLRGSLKRAKEDYLRLVEYARNELSR